MPAPSNTDFLTATDLGSLPASVTQDAHDAGSTYTLYFSFVAASDGVVGVFAFGNLTGYEPVTRIYTGDPNAPDGPYLGIGAQNVPCQFPVDEGETYFLEIEILTDPTPAVLTLEVEMFDNPSSFPPGTILDPDDTEGFPGAFIDQDTGEVVGFIHPFPAGERGDVLDNGRILVEDISDNTVKLYSPQFVLLATVDPFGVALVSTHHIRVSPGLQIFYVGGGQTGGAKITTVNAEGVQGGTTWTLPSNGMGAIGPNNDGSIIYVAGQGGGTNTAIKRWITGSSSMGSDLIAGQGANTSCFDILVLEDDTVIVGWRNSSTDIITIKHLEDDGTLLGTFTVASDDTTSPRLAYDHLTRQTHFWVWSHSSGASTFRKIRVSDMSEVANTGSIREFEGGTYQGSQTATPDARFGISFSCPFLLLRGTFGETLVPGVIGPLAWVHISRRVP